MAIFTEKQKTRVRQEVARTKRVTWVKGDIDLATQAIEDFFEANRPALVAAINTATAPFVFPNRIKKAILKQWLKEKFGVE